MARSAPPPAPVAQNRWTDILAPELGTWVPTERVSVVLPYYEAPDSLARTLAGLASQTYPRELTELVIADDGSDPPAAVPDEFADLPATVVWQEKRGFGLARARNTGAAAAAGEILVFLDSDMVPEPRWLEAHARWHHLVGDALTLGFRRHADFSGITPSEVRAASRSGRLGSLLAGRRQEIPDWIEFHMTRTSELTSGDDDLFRVVTGGNLGIRAQTFHDVGGFDETFTQWGAEDTEFGYRAFTLGALLIPERAASCWHQGLGTLPDAAERASQDDQRARIAHLIAEPSFRRSRPGRSFTVPMVAVEIDGTATAGGEVADLVEEVLASSYHDLLVELHIPPDHPLATWLGRQFGPDPRVALGDDEGARFAAVRIELPPGATISTRTVGTLLERLSGVGLVEVPVSGGIVIRAIKTRALNRARKLGGDPPERVRELFGSRQLRPGEAGVSARRGTVSVARLVRSDTRTGKVAYRLSRVRSPRDAWLVARWLAGAVGWRIRTRLPQRSGISPIRPGTPASSVVAIGILGEAARPWGPGGMEIEGTADLGFRPDIVLVDPGLSRSGEAEELLAAAEEADARVLMIGTAGLHPTVTPIDVRVFNPIGFRSRAGDRFAVLMPPGGGDVPVLAGPPRDVLGGPEHVAVPDGARRLPRPEDDRQLVSMLHGYRGVIDAPSLHRDPTSRASALLSLGAAGVPVVAIDLDERVTALLGPQVVAGLERITIDSLADDHSREALSIELRRAVLSRHTSSGRLRTVVRTAGIPSSVLPTVSVLVPTNRPEQLPHSIGQLSSLRYDALEIVVALHGFERVEQARDLVRASLPDARVVEVPSDLTLGDALNAATRAASGDLVAKLDDDDWYGPDHLTDLVLALEYSGAMLVGKGAEFVHLKDSDVTIRRFVGGAESFSTTIGGGALLLSRSDLIDVGRWPRVRRHVDRALIARVEANGGRIYRTHGFGYVLHRHGDAHTWDADDDYFLAQADDRREGLDLPWAGVAG